MFDPLATIKSEIEQIKAEVRTAVEIGIYREAASNALSRLATLDPANAQKYISAQSKRPANDAAIRQPRLGQLDIRATGGVRWRRRNGSQHGIHCLHGGPERFRIWRP